MSSMQALTAAQYLRMAEELETMATTVARERNVDHHFTERLSLLARQMREDGARLTPPPLAMSGGAEMSGAAEMPGAA